MKEKIKIEELNFHDSWIDTFTFYSDERGCKFRISAASFLKENLRKDYNIECSGLVLCFQNIVKFESDEFSFSEYPGFDIMQFNYKSIENGIEVSMVILNNMNTLVDSFWNLKITCENIAIGEIIP